MATTRREHTLVIAVEAAVAVVDGMRDGMTVTCTAHRGMITTSTIVVWMTPTRVRSRDRAAHAGGRLVLVRGRRPRVITIDHTPLILLATVMSIDLHDLKVILLVAVSRPHRALAHLDPGC